MPVPALRSLCSLALSASLLVACASLEDKPPATSITPMPGLGGSTFKVTARDEQARAWFAQGLQLAYAFEHAEAARVFRAALARDPTCAICAWGLAYSLGPNINNSDRGPVRDIRRYIERAQHTGALHFYVHVAEHSPDARQAETAADGLGAAAPESPHLVHMGSHIYKNIGRFADGSRANEQALEVQKRFDAVLKAQGVQRSGRWDAHHLHFLWYAALMEGRTGLSLRTAREYAQRFGNQDGGTTRRSRSCGRPPTSMTSLVTTRRRSAAARAWRWRVPCSMGARSTKPARRSPRPCV